LRFCHEILQSSYPSRFLYPLFRGFFERGDGPGKNRITDS